jgi:hypothetical protein
MGRICTNAVLIDSLTIVPSPSIVSGLVTGYPGYPINYLVGGIPTPLKNMSSSVVSIIPNICSKPPTSFGFTVAIPRKNNSLG